MNAQLAFSPILEEAAQADERRRRNALDRHRERVQTWFDELATDDKQRLAEWFAIFEWDTCAALAAAAGDYRTTHVANGK